jgi:ABC-type lipoprotein export system ATPase subunit
MTANLCWRSKMITLKNIKCNHSDTNHLFIQIDGPIEFKKNSIYFVIGKSGIGKSTLLNMIASPFAVDSLKSGDILFGDESIAPMSKLGKKRRGTYHVEFSHSPHMKDYYSFIRKHLSFIPQATTSFHPSIPLAKQLYTFYLYAERSGKKKFSELIETLGEAAGFYKVSIDDKFKGLKIQDKKTYITETGENFPVVNIDDSRDPVVVPGRLSQGQKQRLLVLNALLRFDIADSPILLGDEFLVNFSFTEGDSVLRNILERFKNKADPNKVAVFIFHDLSYPFIKSFSGMEEFKDIHKRVILLHKENDDNHTDISIKFSEMSLEDFWSDKINQEGYGLFREFRSSYEISPVKLIEPCDTQEKLKAEQAALKIKIDTFRDLFQKDASILSVISRAATVPRSKEILYEDLNFDMKKGRFIVLTGFSGCGKTQFIKHLLEEYAGDYFKNEKIENKNIFRYFPAMAHEILSYGSTITVKQDLEIMYRFYNQIGDITSPDVRDEIIAHFRDVQLDPMKYGSYEKFLEKHLYDFSGGEVQRYWFGRITFRKNIKEPFFLAFDESISSLDCITKDGLIAYILRELFITRHYTIFFVTHDLRDINVIYRTLRENGLGDHFEHYEMFGKKIYKVLTDFDSYRENAFAGGYNKYGDLVVSPSGRKIINGKNIELRIKRKEEEK